MTYYIGTLLLWKQEYWLRKLHLTNDIFSMFTSVPLRCQIRLDSQQENCVVKELEMQKKRVKVIWMALTLLLS